MQRGFVLKLQHISLPAAFHRLGLGLCFLFMGLSASHAASDDMGADNPSAATGAGRHPGMHPGMHAAMRGALGPSIQLEHSAQQDIANDLASLGLFAEFRDKEAGVASQKAAAALTAALARVQSDSAISDRRTALQTWMDYGPDGKTAGWRARAELTLEGKDFAALSKAAGRLSPDFAVSSVSYRLSHEARQQEEQKLITRAIASWREKAANITTALGYTGFEPRDVQVRTSSDLGGGPGMPMARMGSNMLMASSADAAPAPVIEAGKSRVSVTIAGSVRPK
jgi:predicted secreted protein